MSGGSSSTSIAYPTAVSTWSAPEADCIFILSEDGRQILGVSVNFLRQGQVLRWPFLLSLISICVTEQGKLVNAKGKNIKPASAPVAGKYTFKTASKTVTFTSGPIGKQRNEPPTGTSVSTMSHSSRSSVNQNKFGVAVIARDGYCPVSGTAYDNCVASHLVPYSRDDIYATLGIANAFHVSCGLLLGRTEHHAYDAYAWSLFAQPNGDLVVHYFEPTRPAEFAYHGRIIPKSFFRGQASMHPNLKMIDWHYKQTVLMHLRGFHVS